MSSNLGSRGNEYLKPYEMDSNYPTTMSNTEGPIYDIIFAGGQFHLYRELEISISMT